MHFVSLPLCTTHTFDILYFILFLNQVPDDNLIDRCVGRRLDPVTGKIYHVKNFPPENEEISARLLTRSDDTFEKVLLFFTYVVFYLFCHPRQDLKMYSCLYLLFMNHLFYIPN
jgi:hypothetical protein